MAQILLVQVMLHEHLQKKSIGEFEIQFEEIAFKGNLNLRLCLYIANLAICLPYETQCAG